MDLGGRKRREAEHAQTMADRMQAVAEREEARRRGREIRQAEIAAEQARKRAERERTVAGEAARVDAMSVDELRAEAIRNLAIVRIGAADPTTNLLAANTYLSLAILKKGSTQ